jgi:hypothetical protein
MPTAQGRSKLLRSTLEVSNFTEELNIFFDDRADQP